MVKLTEAYGPSVRWLWSNRLNGRANRLMAMAGRTEGYGEADGAVWSSRLNRPGHQTVAYGGPDGRIPQSWPRGRVNLAQGHRQPAGSLPSNPFQPPAPLTEARAANVPIASRSLPRTPPTPSPREARAGRGLGRGADPLSMRLLSPALSSTNMEERETKPSSPGLPVLLQRSCPMPPGSPPTPTQNPNLSPLTHPLTTI